MGIAHVIPLFRQKCDIKLQTSKEGYMFIIFHCNPNQKDKFLTSIFNQQGIRFSLVWKGRKKN